MTNQEALDLIVKDRQGYQSFATAISQSTNDPTTFDRYINAFLTPSMSSHRNASFAASLIAASTNPGQYASDVSTINGIFAALEPYDVNSIRVVYFSAYADFATAISLSEASDEAWTRWRLAYRDAEMDDTRSLLKAAIAAIPAGEPSEVASDAAILVGIFDAL